MFVRDASHIYLFLYNLTFRFMKNLFLSLAMLSLAAFVFAGCTAAQEEPVIEETMAVEEVVEPDMAVEPVMDDAAAEATVEVVQ